MTVYSTCPGKPHLYAAVTAVFSTAANNGEYRAYRIERRGDGGLDTEAAGAITKPEKAAALAAFRQEENRRFDGRTYVRPGDLSTACADKNARRWASRRSY